jgi:DNA-binding LacI/PurR family transcriptional regulator
MDALCEQEPTSKTDQAYVALMKLIEARGPGIKLPTIDEMCVQFNLSRTPLENAIRAIETRGLLRRRRGSGIYVADRVRQKTIGVVFGGNIFSSGFSPFWSLLLEAVRQQVGERELRPQVYLDISDGHEGLGGHTQLVEALEARRLDGLLLLAPQSVRDEAAELRAYGVPLVVFGGQSPEWVVTHDWRPVFSLAARELATRGCRRVAILGLTTDADRQQLEHDLREAGYEGEPVLDWSYHTWVPRIPGSQTRESFGRELARRMIANRANHPLPDSLVSFDDTMTRGVITALQEAGLQPGRDIQIATTTTKGSPVLEPYTSNLIEIEYDPATSVRAAFDMLDILMNGGTPPQNRLLIAPRVARAFSP